MCANFAFDKTSYCAGILHLPIRSINSYMVPFMTETRLIDEKSDRVLLWSNEHQSWWRPNSQGYSPNIARAGLYDRKEAESIVKSAGKKNEQIVELEFGFLKLQGQAWEADKSMNKVIIYLQHTDVLSRT